MPRYERSFVVLLLAVLSVGCGGEGLQIHARAAMVTGAVLGQAGELLVQARGDALDGVVVRTEGMPREDRLATLVAAEAAWQPAIVAYEGARLALVAWIESISLANAAGGDEDVMGHVVAMVGRLLGSWDPFAASMRALGVDIPALPDALRDLALVLGGGDD